MRIFALVYLVAILGFHKVQCDGLSMDREDGQSSPLEDFSQENDFGHLVSQPENQDAGQERSEASGLALDVVNLDSSNFTLFECNDNGNEIIFVIPRNDVSVDMVVCGETTIWTPGEDEEFEYAKLFLKDGEPRIVFIAKSKDSTATGRWYARNGDVWENCKDTYQEKIKAIRVPIPRINPFILNIEDDRDTRECRIFNIKLLGIQMRLYFAKPEYSAEEVMYNRTSIWKGSKDELCTACDLYFNKGELSFLILSVKENDVIRYEYFETRGKEWKTMTSEEFNNRRKEAQTTHGNFDVQEESAKKEKKRSKRNALGQLFSRNKEQESTYSQSHKQSSSQEENAESERSQEGEHATVSSGQDGIILDLAKLDETKLDVYAETKSEVTVKAYTPKDWLHISSVMDRELEVWEARAGQKCVFVESYAKGGVELLYLETSGGTMSKYFEKVDGQWNEIDEELFYEKARTFIGESGKDASLDLASPSRLLCKSFEYSFAGNAIKLVVPKKNVEVTKLVSDSETIWTADEGETFDHTKVYLNKDGKPELASVTLKTSSGVSHKAYSKNGGGWTFCADSETKMKGLRTSATFKSNFTMDISSVTSTKECTVFEVYLLGVTTRHFYPKPGYVSIKVKDGDKRLWTFINPSDACLFCFIYKRDNKEVLEMAVVNGILRRWKFFERVDGNEWKKVDKGKFLGKLKEIREPENPVSIFASKVDTSLFDLEESLEGSVKVLKLTPKGDKVTQVKYDNKEVWSGSKTLGKSSNLVEALIYFDGDIPVLTTIKAVKGGKESTVYKYYDGKQWKDDKEDDHKNKLETLKEGLKPTTTSSSSIALDLANPDQSKVLVYDRSGNGIKSKNYSPKDGHHISSVVDGGMSIWNATGDERCTLVKLSTRGDSSLLLMSLESAKKYFEKNGEEWKSIEKTEFDQKLNDMEEMNKSERESATSVVTSPEPTEPKEEAFPAKPVEFPALQSEAQSFNLPQLPLQHLTPEPTHPESSLVSKVDTSLFNVEDGEDDGIRVLKLIPKIDKVTKVKYDGKEIWSGSKIIGTSSNLVEALLYFNEDSPALVTIHTIKGTNKYTVYKHLDGSKWQNDKEDDHKKKLGALKEDYKPIGKPEDNPPVSSTPLEQDTLNISRVDQSNLEYFEYTHDDNLTQLIVPKKDVTVAKIVRGSDTVWTPSSGEKFEYSKLYLDKDRKLELILVASTLSSNTQYNYFAKNGSKWECTLKYAEKLKALKVVSSSKTDISIDLENEEDTDKFRVLNVELLNVPTRFHLPNPECHSNNVRSSEDVLWEAVGDEKCTSCAVYSKNGNHLLSLFIKDGDKSDYKHFEKADGTWSFISEEEFNKKYKNMQVTASHTSGDATFTESKEVDKEEPDQQSGDNAAGPVTDPQESWDTKSESSTNDPSYQSPTEESVLVGSDKNEETATAHEDIPHQSFSSHSDEQSGSDDSASQDTEFSEAASEVTTVEHEEQTPQESGSDHSEEQLQTEQATSDSQPDADTNEEPEVVPSETSATETLDLASPDDSKVDFSNGDDKRNVVEASEKGEESTPPLDIDGNTQTKSFENSTEWNDHSNERSLGQESHNLSTSELRGSRTSISSRRQNRRDSTASTISTTSTASTLSLDQTGRSTTLKLTKPDDSIYQSFEYHHDDSHIKLVLPQGGVIVTKLLESWFTIWTGKTGEALEYAKVYLKKDGKPGFVRVWKRDSSGVKCVNYTTGRVYGWSEFKGDVSTKINPLKVPVERKGDSVIDLKNEEDTDECRIFSVELMNIQTDFYFPKPGYYAAEVKDGDESLWKAAEGTYERCLSCDVYTKDEQRILSLSKKKNDKTDDAFFEFSDGEWKHITEEEFLKKFQAMINGPSQEPEISEHESLPSGEAEGADSTVTSNDSVNVGKIEDNESEHISEECKDPEISSVLDTEQESTDIGFSESGQSDLGAQSGQTNQQGSYDTQTSSQSLNIPEDQDPMTDNSEGNDTVDADSSITPDNTVKEASEGEVELEKEDDREYKEPISATEDVIQNSEKSMPSENAALEEANSESSISSDSNPVDSCKLDENGAGSSESSTDGQSNEVSTDGFSDRAKEMMKGEQEIPEVKLQTVEDNNTTGVSDSTSSTQEDKEQTNVSDTQSHEGSVNEPQNGSTAESTDPFEPSKPDDELKGEEELPEASESTPGIMDKIKNFKSSAISSVFSSNKNQESNNTADSSNDSKNSSKQSKLKKTFSGLGNKAKNIMNSKQ